MSRSGSYAWRKRQERAAKDQWLADLIVECQKKCRQTYGIRRVRRCIQRQAGKNVNLKAILRLMRKLNLLSVVRRRRPYSHASDSLVFSACNAAITELQNLVRIAINRMNRTQVIITADHGFLYTFSPLKEDSKVDKTSFNQMDVEYGRRYAIMRQSTQPDYLMPVRFMNETSGLTAFTTRESMRIKMQGGGLNFDHGGVSLQEICVPVISYHHLRNASKEYQKNKSKYDTTPVTVSLLSASRKISNMIFSLNFYQKEAVGDNRVAQTYQLYFTDEYGKQISDVQKIIADRTAQNNQDKVTGILNDLKLHECDDIVLINAIDKKPSASTVG